MLLKFCYEKWMQMLSVVLSMGDIKLLKHILNFKRRCVMFRWSRAQEIGIKTPHMSVLLFFRNFNVWYVIIFQKKCHLYYFGSLIIVFRLCNLFFVFKYINELFLVIAAKNMTMLFLKTQELRSFQIHVFKKYSWYCES